MLARTPFTRTILAKPKPAARLSQDRRRALIDELADILRDQEPTPFAGEGPCRHGVRSALCEGGQRWAAADAIAGELVAEALRRVGAKRPTWQEGQPEYTQPGVHPVQRERCIRCRKPLPEGHSKYCGHVCKGGHNAEMQRQRRREEINLQWLANQAARAAKRPEQPCEGCEAMFRPRKPGQRFCRQACSTIVR